MKIDKISLSLITITIVFLLLPGIAGAAENKSPMSYLASADNITTDNQSAWITINPVSDHYVGEKISITGSTNIPEGEEIWIDIGSSRIIPGRYKYQSSGSVQVVKGVNSQNIWSYPVDTSTFKPDEYVIIMIAQGYDASAGKIFNVSQESEPGKFRTTVIPTIQTPTVFRTTQSTPLPVILAIGTLGCVGAIIVIRKRAKKLK